MLDPLVDKDKAVRVEAARALAQLGELAVPVLRLRVLIPGEEPEVLGQCFLALLAIERDAAIPFVAGFLEAGDDAAGEAAFALAETRSPAALAALLKRQKEFADEWFTGVLLSAIAMTRLPEAIDFLIGLIEREEREAASAIEALSRMAASDELRARVREAVEATGEPKTHQSLARAGIRGAVKGERLGADAPQPFEEVLFFSDCRTFTVAQTRIILRKYLADFFLKLRGPALTEPVAMRLCGGRRTIPVSRSPRDR